MEMGVGTKANPRSWSFQSSRTGWVHFASEITSIVNVEEEIEKLKLKFQAIQAKLDDLEERQVKEKAVKLWLERLNDVSYEMGDVLDEWNTAKIKADIEKKEEAETSTAKRRKR